MATKALVLVKRLTIGAKRLPPLRQLLRQPRIVWSRLLSNAAEQFRQANRPLLTELTGQASGFGQAVARAERLFGLLRSGARIGGIRATRLVPLTALTLGLGLTSDSSAIVASSPCRRRVEAETALDRVWEAADRSLPRPAGLDELQLIRLIGCGGYSGVLEARPRLPGGANSQAGLAVKRYFNPGIESVAYCSLQSQFDRELRLLSGLSHPGLARAVAGFVGGFQQAEGDQTLAPAFMPSSQHPDGCGRNATYYMVMPLYEGSLADLLAVRGPIGRAESLMLLAQLVEADAYLKTVAKIAHRDVKAGNVAVRGVGPHRRRLVLIDFGEATSPLIMPLPHHSVVRWGNSSLMPPEVVRAKTGPDSAIDYTRSDLWAICTLAWELVGLPNPFIASANGGRCSRQPYQPEDLASLASLLGPRADRLLRRLATAEDPADRPTSDWVAKALRRLLGYERRRQRLDRRLFGRWTAEELLALSAALPLPWLRPLLLLPEV